MPAIRALRALLGGRLPWHSIVSDKIQIVCVYKYKVMEVQVRGLTLEECVYRIV